MYFDNNKNIDDYFKKGLKDYSQVPEDAVWGNIERQLSEEKKLKQLFFYKVAAGLLIFIGLANFLAFEVSYFSGSEKNLASMNLNEELQNSIENQKVEKYSPGDYNVNNDNQLIASDVSIPQNILSDQDIQSQMAAIEEKGEERNLLRDQRSLSKMTALDVKLANKTKEPDFTELRNQPFFNKSKIPTREFSLSNNTVQNSQQRGNLFSLSGSFSPIMSYRSTKMKTSNSTMPKEKSMLSYSGGMNVGYSIGDRLTLRTGIHYAKLGQSLNSVEVSSDSYGMDGETTVINVASSMGPGQIKTNSLMQQGETEETPKYITHDNSVLPEFTIEPALYQTFEMMKLPFILEYRLLDERFNISVIGGVNANLLVNEGIYMEQAESTKRIGSTKELSKLSYSGTFGIGLNYDVSEKAQLFMEPSFDYYITSLSSDNSYQTFPYYFGFFSGVSISF